MLPIGQQSNVVYHIPCSCGQVYIGETKQRLETRDTCERGMMERLAVAEHVWESHHHQLGGDISAGQGWRSRGTTVEGGPSHPDDTCNRGSGLEIPGCWSALMRRKGGMVLTNL